MIRIRVKNIFGQIANRLKHTSAYHGHKKEGPYKQSYISPRSQTPLIYETIGQRLDRAAELYENRDCFIDFKSGVRLTFKELKQQAEDLASGLIAIGLNRGDRIGLWAPNCIEWALTQYATALAGIIQVNINPAYKTNELEYSLNKVGCKAVIMSETFKTQNYVKMLTDLCPEVVDSKPGELNSKKLPQLKSVIVISDKKTHDGFYQFEQVLDGGDSSHRIRLDRLRKEIEPSDTINIQYTSGTTGHPKGVELSHHMILNNALQTTQLQEYDTNRTIICLQVPLYHCFGMVIGSLSTITSGTTCVFPSPSFDPEQSFKSIFKEKCTSIYGTPTMFVDLLNHQDLGKYDLSSVNTAVIGGSTSPSELMLNSIKKLNTRNIICAYGLTETSPVITTGSKHDSLENRTQTIGRALDHLELKVVDKLGKVVGVNEPGELLVRGYNTMIGYWDEKGKTDETFTPDRFLKTGDIVKMDEYGYFHHLSRLKDVVIRGGENIYPKEVEDFLHTHPKIADVYVVGVPDARMGEELCACVRLVKDEQMSPQELKDYCKDKISHFKIPRYIEFTDDFPITVTGKVQKNKLREFMTKKLHLVK